MDPPASPPKRLTRSRAAGKASTATASTASSAARKVATVATKTSTARTAAGVTASSSTIAAAATRTSTKRKTRPDDHEDDSDAEPPAKLPPAASRTAARAARGPGRPKKSIDPKPKPTAAPAAARTTRGRPPKKLAPEPVKEEPPKSTRTRAKRAKVDHDDDVDDLAPDSVKKPTRGRPAGSTASAKAPASKHAKKTTPTTKPTDTTTAGMRAKPIRKPAAAGRTTKSTATKKNTKEDTKETDDKAPMPLSPRKATQLSVTRDQDVDSEDELAMDRTPARPLHKNPMKPPVSMKPPVETKEETPPADEDTATLAPTEPTVFLGSPVRRPPPSPFKDAMKSPAKRIEGLQLGFSARKEPTQPGASPSKASLMQSPAKRCPVSIKPIDLGSSSRHDQSDASPFKQSLFQSPARRLFSPMKSLKLPEPHPEPETDAQSPAPAPALLCPPVQDVATEESQEDEASDAETEPDMEDEVNDGENATNSSIVGFNGQMSAVLHREPDTIPNPNTSLADHSIEEEDDGTVVLEDEYEQVTIIEDGGEPMTVDEPEPESEPEAENIAPGDVSTTPPNSPPQQALGYFGLRQQDQVSFDMSYSESMEEPSRVMTPKSVSPVKHMKGSVMKPRTSGFGFTPLAQRLDSWETRSPSKDEVKAVTSKSGSSTTSGKAAATPQDSPMKNAFFEDEMASSPDAAANDSSNETEIPEIKDPICEDISLTDEDFELVAESNEMSVMSPEQVESMLNVDRNEESMSEDSQEYGDENEVPAADPHSGTPVPPVTPQRNNNRHRELHTVSKIPLKPADESTPPPQPSLKKRRHSISRIPEGRPTHGLTRSATVISYSPSHKRHVEPAFEEAVEEEDSRSRAGSVPPVTPTKSETWSNAGSPTPAQTPRHEVDPALLRGAVVFVDVHTMEGADASAIFVELLTQMGARCVKHWTWNPNDEGASSKIGITHVVYKDGGKRTMERVRETGGIVQCVGVGWVLDCERANEWLDESPYYIDTSLIPRGGARRRKSMEPKALANVNGIVVSDSANRRASARENQTAPSTPAPANRRDSTLWMHSPDDYEEGDEEDQEYNEEISYDQQDWFNSAPLTPVPKTPAPEAIHRFAMEMTPDMNSPMMDADDDDDVELSREQLIQRTCPPKTQHMYEDLGAGVLGHSKDESVARRLMDARRKSLAFAPKVSSPLAKSWKEWN
ncbi:hypothetical protein VM1G_06212 [Cytospora mali]|uniref:BRCT domain-containing protein n=1 Tax=Cytospora mali TaxID=578113 RepID=A0A194W2D5_CYTMA|nr:hypothetical protein VM1G_06212 [Valsa mali]